MAHDFKPNAGGKVSKKDAEGWIQKYDDEDRKDKDKDTRFVFFGKEFLMEIFKNAPEAAGISFYLAKKHSDLEKKNVIDLVLVPTREDGTHIWPKLSDGKDEVSEGAYDNGARCPPTCK
ncbi:MAG TPA: hypothetical protein VD884_07070 [Ohtaekwangia sp.]|nr:hypothetical protein [Ohtaekwangia sp.]